MTEQRFAFDTESEASKQRLWEAFKTLPTGRYSISIEPLGRKRSLEQNARYFAILTDISQQVLDENGRYYSPETWHEFMKAKFLGKDTMLVDGEPVLVPQTTTKLKVLEFSDYCTQIEAWGIDHGVKFWMEESA